MDAPIQNGESLRVGPLQGDRCEVSIHVLRRLKLAANERRSKVQLVLGGRWGGMGCRILRRSGVRRSSRACEYS